MKAPFAYRLLYRYAGFCFRLFYKVNIQGAENIPTGKPVIFASNHQNALMDALAMLFAAKRPVYFLARADIFKSPFIAGILTFLKMFPVYRLRDEVDIVEKNREIFEKTAFILSEGQSLGILPEGTHTSYKHLQLLKKGICRIAFEAAREDDFKLPIQIVPVGLDYSNYNKQGSELLVIFGSPINVSEYYQLYKENPNRAVTLLRNDLQFAIRGLMIDISNPEEYEFIYRYSLWTSNHKAGTETADSYKRFLATREEVERLKTLFNESPEIYAMLKDEFSFLLVGNPSGKANIKPPATNKRLLWMVIKSLISSLGLVLNFVPYVIAGNYSEKVKDPQFKSSVKYGSSLVLFPLWFGVVFFVTALAGGFIAAFVVMIFVMITALFAMRNPL